MRYKGDLGESESWFDLYGVRTATGMYPQKIDSNEVKLLSDNTCNAGRARTRPQSFARHRSSLRLLSRPQRSAFLKEKKPEMVSVVPRRSGRNAVSPSVPQAMVVTYGFVNELAIFTVGLLHTHLLERQNKGSPRNEWIGT